MHLGTVARRQGEKASKPKAAREAEAERSFYREVRPRLEQNRRLQHRESDLWRVRRYRIDGEGLQAD